MRNRSPSIGELAELTERTYLDCAGRHDGGRRYPYPAPDYLVWSDVLPEFEEELAIVRHNAALARASGFEGALDQTFFTQRLKLE